MNSTAQLMKGTNATSMRATKEITEADTELAVEASEKVRKHLDVQATEVGPVLEALLRDMHGQIRWGLNE